MCIYIIYNVFQYINIYTHIYTYAFIHYFQQCFCKLAILDSHIAMWIWRGLSLCRRCALMCPRHPPPCEALPRHVYVDSGENSLEDAFKKYRFSLIVDDEENTISRALIHSIGWATWYALRNAMVHSSHEYRSVSSVNILSRKSTSSASKLWILWGPNYCSCRTLFDFQAATICYALTTRETRTFSGKGSVPLFNGFSHLLAMLPRVVLPWNRSHFHIEQCLGRRQGGWNHCFEGRIQPIAPSSLSPTRK